MSGWVAGWLGAGAGAALLLLLALCRRNKSAAPPVPLAVHQVHIVEVPTGAARTSAPPPAAAPPHLSAPPPPLPADAAPQIVIVQSSTQSTIAQHSQSPPPPPIPIASTSSQPPVLPEYKGIPKLPLPEQFLHKRPFDYKYCSTIPRPLAHIVSSELGSDLNQESRAKKFSATRSPSLEKDEKSPFLSAKSDRSDVFGFDEEVIKKVSSRQSSIEAHEEMTEKPVAMSPKEGEDTSPGNLRRYRSVSTRLNMYSVNESLLEGQSERLEMQNSPRVVECSSAREKSSGSKFNFSPQVSDSISSPRFFTPPETVSPMFFPEPSPRSVYYDVKSPRFFAETPKEAELPQSPRTLGDNLNRNNGVDKPSSKPNSPRILSARPSPKVYSCNKENYFTFDYVNVTEEGVTRASPRPKRYGGRNSIERERFTPPADKDAKKYRRHNSCDTNYKNIELNIAKGDDNKVVEDENKLVDNDVVDCCVKMDMLHLEPKADIDVPEKLMPLVPNSEQARRQRLKSISLDSDNAKIIELNLGLPIAKQMKDQMNEAYKNQEATTSCESIKRLKQSSSIERQTYDVEDDQTNKSTDEEELKSPDLTQKKSLRHSSNTQSFLDMPRFSPKEFEITVTSEEGDTSAAEVHTKRKGKNLRNLTIDLTKRDSDLEKELLEFEKLYTNAEEKKVKTPTLKIKATSLDSSETVNLSLPQKKILEIPQNSVSMPNTPKRQLQRILAQKGLKHELISSKSGHHLQLSADQRRLYMKTQDSGIFLRENHASLMLYQPGTSRIGSRTMGSFDENMTDLGENAPEINISGADSRSPYTLEPGQTLGSNLLNYKQNLSVSSTNLKTLPEGVPSDDFEPTAEDEKFGKKLHRRNSNQSLMLSTHSLQSSNCSLNSSGTSCHNLNNVRASLSNFSLNSEGRRKLSLDRRDSNTSLGTNEHLAPTTRVICSSNTNLSGETAKNCLLQRRGSNNSLTLNITNTLSRHSSNSSLNKEAKPGLKKGLLERRSSNTSLTLNINNSNPQLSVNRGLSISNYNLNGSTCNLSRYNSQSIDQPAVEPRKGILERRSSNTSLTLNIQPQEPRDLEIDVNVIESNLKDSTHRDKHRKSLSTENLIPKSYKNRLKLRTGEDSCVAFGSHDNLWSTSYNTEQEYNQNLTYVCGDQENEIIYAFGRQDEPNYQAGFVRNITTKPLSPQSTSEDFRQYLANMQHLQNASSVLTRQHLKDLNDVFQNGYSKVKCLSASEGQHCCSNKVSEVDTTQENPQMVIPDPVTSLPCSEYQKMLLRNLHQEFWDMPTNFQEKPIVSGSHAKNRYKKILPNEHSRFILDQQEGSTCEEYINANYIKGYEYTRNSYIATQGPLQNTIYDFWHMVVQNTVSFREHPPPYPLPHHYGVQKIVMLANFSENNRQKCEKYFPLELNEEISFADPQNEVPATSYVIKNCGMINKYGYTIRRLQVEYATDSVVETVMVHHYWFHHWADHKCPKDVNALLNLSLDVIRDVKYDFSEVTKVEQLVCKCESPSSDSKFVFPPLESQTAACEVTVDGFTCQDLSAESSYPATVVHCSAGIGRTGCIIAIFNGVRQLLNEQKVDVLGIVCNMRLNRGGMVENSEQYELIHKVLCVFEQVCLPGL